MGFVSISGGDVNPRPPYTPTVVGSGFTNEPVGYTLIQDTPWDAFPWWPTSPVGPDVKYLGWIDDNRLAGDVLTVINDPTSPYPWVDHNVVQLKFTAGFPGGSSPLFVWRPLRGAELFKNLFIGLWCKHSANFTENGNTGIKFVWVAGDQEQGGFLYTGHDGPNMNFMLIQQNAVDRNLSANLNAAQALLLAKRGQWVKYEMLFKANTDNSTADGEYHQWIDGVKTTQYPNPATGDLGVNYQMAAARQWLSVAWNPTYGGGTNPVPADQYQYMDHIRISGHA